MSKLPHPLSKSRYSCRHGSMVEVLPAAALEVTVVATVVVAGAGGDARHIADSTYGPAFA